MAQRGVPAKFQLNAAITATQRDMLDTIAAGGRGPSDTAVVKMLLAALENYWNKTGVMPSPMRLVADVKAEALRKAAADAAEFEEEGFSGVISLPDVGEGATVQPQEHAPRAAEEKAGASAPLSVDEMARGEQRRREKAGTLYPKSKRGGAAKERTTGKTGRG